jgi:coproporphyrinogen III oxidase-like Fe-S oxidoreductase
VQREERVMLGLRLDEPLPVALVAASLDPTALARLERLGLAQRVPLGVSQQAEGALTLTSRGRLLGDAVTADLLA